MINQNFTAKPINNPSIRDFASKAGSVKTNVSLGSPNMNREKDLGYAVATNTAMLEQVLSNQAKIMQAIIELQPKGRENCSGGRQEC